MKKLYIVFISILAFSLGNYCEAQNVRKEIRSGNKKYTDGNFQDAELSYRKALENSDNKEPDALYNLGSSLYQQENYEAAAGSWAMTADQVSSKKEKSEALFNLGNSLVKNQKFDEAVAAYKEALRQNPKDKDARYNLEYARKMLAQQQQQQQQDQQNQDQNKDKDKQDKEDQQDQQNQDQQDQQNQDQQDQQNQDQQDQQNKDQQDQQNQDQQDQQNQDQQDQQKQPQPQQISKEDAQRMLEALNQDEKETMEKINSKKVKATRVKIEKDW